MSVCRRSFLKTIAAALSIIGFPTTLKGESLLVEGVAGEVLIGGPPEPHLWKWWLSFDGGEVYSETFNTREEAIQAAVAHEGATIAECKKQDYDLRVDGGDIIEMIDGKNEDLKGEDGYSIECSTAESEELGRMITAAIRAWVEKNHIDTTAWVFGGVRNVEDVLYGVTDPADMAFRPRELKR